MSINSEINRIKGNLSDAYDKIVYMGGTAPEERTSENLIEAILSIPKDQRFFFPIETQVER